MAAFQDLITLGAKVHEELQIVGVIL